MSLHADMVTWLPVRRRVALVRAGVGIAYLGALWLILWMLSCAG